MSKQSKREKFREELKEVSARLSKIKEGIHESFPEDEDALEAVRNLSSGKIFISDATYSLGRQEVYKKIRKDAEKERIKSRDNSVKKRGKPRNEKNLPSDSRPTTKIPSLDEDDSYAKTPPGGDISSRDADDSDLL